jgi:hypothetical protein
MYPGRMVKPQCFVVKCQRLTIHHRDSDKPHQQDEIIRSVQNGQKAADPARLFILQSFLVF